MEPLWAKSGRKRTLVEHTGDVVSSFDAMFGTIGQPSRLGLCWARFFRLDDYPRFWNTTLASVLFHDWGKSNDGFQDAVLHGGEQSIRHEHLSTLLLAQDNVHRWVSARTDIDWDVVLSAVLTHHLKVRSEANAEYGFASLSPHGTLIELPVEHPDFAHFLKQVGDRLRLNGETPKVDRFWSFDGKDGCVDVVTARSNLVDGRLHALDRQVGGKRPKDLSRRRLLWAVRATVIVADAVGSAMPRTGQSIIDWIEGTLTKLPLCTDEYIWTEIIDRRVQELRAKQKWNDDNGLRGWSELQVGTGALPDRALLLAPCGSGKTLAAWRWIAERCKRGVQRVIFLYPTRATATEGFRDYVSWAPEDDAALVHGASGFDLDGMFENPASGDARTGRLFSVNSRLYSLAIWPRRIFSATVDQFLGFMQYAYNPMLALPLLADSVVVIDEVHSFDRGMFSALKDFLREFDVPVLCMTASLPSERQIELTNDCGLTLYDEKPGDLGIVSAAPRYRIALATESQLPALVHEKLSEGKRVLWVVNQVKWAQALVKVFARTITDPQLATDDGIPICCYHSRFRLQDRRARHQETIRAFQGQRRATLAITTQVCEMSLDMDADVLITQMSPITALIQRMGRCNRASIPRDTAGQVFVYKPENNKPYSPADLQGVPEFLNALVGKPSVSQSDLEVALQDFGPTAVEVPKVSSFLESGPYAMGGDETFRDIDEFTVRAVLDSDVDEFLRLQSTKDPTDGLIVPVPNRKTFFLERERVAGRFPSYLQIASHHHYHPALGFCDYFISSDGALNQ